MEELPIPTTAPEGYTLVQFTDEYYGSHEEYGNGDEEVFLAIPNDAYEPEVEYSTGHGDYSYQPVRPCPPPGTLFFETFGGEWLPFNVATNQMMIDEQDARVN